MHIPECLLLKVPSVDLAPLAKGNPQAGASPYHISLKKECLHTDYAEACMQSMSTTLQVPCLLCLHESTRQQAYRDDLLAIGYDKQQVESSAAFSKQSRQGLLLRS